MPEASTLARESCPAAADPDSTDNSSSSIGAVWVLLGGVVMLDAVHRSAGRNDEPIRFPAVIQELRRTDKEVVRISLDRFKNSFTIEMRSTAASPMTP